MGTSKRNLHDIKSNPGVGSYNVYDDQTLTGIKSPKYSFTKETKREKLFTN